MKKCPFCAEEIQDEAIKCRYCNELLYKTPPPLKWYFRPTGLVLAFLMVGPLALPLVWLHPRYTKKNKIVVSAVMLIISLLLCIVLVFSVSNIVKYYRQVYQLF